MAIHYASATGSATWANSTSISTPCSLATANTNAAAGDTVYFRGGTYTINSTAAIAPTHSGTVSSKIVYARYLSETPYFVSSGGVNDYDSAYGIAIQNHAYIIVDGFTFEDFFFWIAIYQANHNEVRYCTFYNLDVGADNAQTIYIGDYGGLGTPSTHNWIHHNTAYRAGAVLPEEGCDMIRIGSGAGGWDDVHSNNNTIEDNVVYWAGHTLSEDYCEKNVWRRNHFHNEGWKDSAGYAIYGTATGGSSGVLIDSSKNFTDLGVTTGWKVCSLSEYDGQGVVTSITGTIHPNDTLHFSGLTFSAGVGYVVVNMHGDANNSHAPSPPGTVQNGKFSHRCMSITGMPGGTLNKQILIEGNRVGFAGTNCNNNGADGMTLGGPGALVRFNDIFGCDGPGINWKGYGAQSEASYDGTYVNNTLYKNGQAVVGDINPPVRTAFHFYNGYSTNNRVKNCIMWQNGPAGGPYVYGMGGGADQTHQTWANNAGDHTDASFGCVNYGDPLFVNTGLTSPDSLTVPDLRLQATSPLIGQGGYLTQANGGGSNSTTLTVDDDKYFQDGSWGSELSDIQPDWIAVGTVGNIVQIDSINRTTHAITLASPISWSDNDPIWLYKNSSGDRVLYGSAPDIGAHPYTSGSPGGVVLAVQGCVHSHTSTQLVLGTGPAGSFSLSAFPTSRTIVERNTTPFTIFATSIGGFSGNINLSVSGVPSGCTATFGTNPIGPDGSSILTIDTTNMSVPTGTYTITVNGIEA